MTEPVKDSWGVGSQSGLTEKMPQTSIKQMFKQLKMRLEVSGLLDSKKVPFNSAMMHRALPRAQTLIAHACGPWISTTISTLLLILQRIIIKIINYPVAFSVKAYKIVLEEGKMYWIVCRMFSKELWIDIKVTQVWDRQPINRTWYPCIGDIGLSFSTVDKLEAILAIL